MGGTLVYHNHPQQHNHNTQLLQNHPPFFISSSSSSSSRSPFSSSPFSPFSEPLSFLTSPLSPTQQLAGPGAAATIDSPSHSLSSWVEWPTDQHQNRQLGSGPGSAVGIAIASTRAVSARARRPKQPPRHRRQRSARQAYKPPTSSPSSATAPASTSPTSPSRRPGAGSTSSASSTDAASAVTMSDAPSDAPARPSKRSTDGTNSDDPTSSQSTGKPKLPRLERGPDDFSNVVKNRLQSYTRTGQACDRCKVRKIRCDALPEGCSHCINLNLDCYVTDRVTGRTERRGYMQQLEREKSGMLNYIRDLEKRLADNGIDVKPWPGPVPTQNLEDGHDAQPPSSASSVVNESTRSGSVMAKSKSPSSGSASATPPMALRPRLHASRSSDEDQTRHDDNETSALRSIKGTVLTLLDMTLDTAGFDAPEMDEPSSPSPTVPLYQRSFQAFLHSVYKINPTVPIEMPTRHDAFTFCDWYFLVFAPYFPLLHKPSLMRVVTGLYDEPGFAPSASELMILHLIFAMIYHNYGTRNWQLEGRIHFTALADKHYHFALGKFSEVMGARDLPAVQAFTMLAIYMRSFSKPGSFPIILGLALQKALELGLHRKDETPGEGTNLNKELRKRTWWCLMSVSVFVLGRLGRPMPISVHDFDAEMPEAIADEHLKEDGVDEEQTMTCSYGAGFTLQKLTKIMMEIYSHLYSTQRDLSQYPQVLEVLEERLHAWEDELPDILRLDKPQQPETLVQAYYAKMFLLEVRLYLRHPSVVPASHKQLREENKRITEATSREMLNLALEIIKYRAIDTTWYHMSLFVVCIFSTLSIKWEQRVEMTPEQLAMLRDEMGRWIIVIKDMMILTGNGPGLLYDVTRIIDRTLSWIEHDMRNQDFRKSRSSPPAILGQYQPLVHPGYSTHTTLAPSDGASLKEYFEKSAMTTQTIFPVAQYGNPSQNTAVTPTYTAEQPLFYDSTQTSPATVVPLASGRPSVQVNPMGTFGTSAANVAAPLNQTNMMWQTRGSLWNEWDGTVTDSQDRYSANTVLPGTRGPSVTEDAMAMASAATIPADATYTPNTQWPMTLFDIGPGSGSGGL